MSRLGPIRADCHVQSMRVGQDALLVEVDDAASALSLALWSRDLGVDARDVVPAARTVLFDGVGDLDGLARLLVRWARHDAATEHRLVEIPTVYDGADLEHVATSWGCSVAEAVERHGDRVHGELLRLRAGLLLPRRSARRVGRAPAARTADQGSRPGPSGWPRGAVAGARLRRPGSRDRRRAGDRGGVRSYLAISGGIDVEPVLGSRSTDTLAWIGPPVVRGHPAPGGVGPRPSAPGWTRHGCRHRDQVLRLHPGPRAAWFTDNALEVLTGTSYAVTADSYRIGLRLAGRPLDRAREGSCPARGWCSVLCRCRRTASRSCSSTTTR